ncbi:hypothetical protein MBLNU230_g6193t1 [Neophaeotheca triangularis]
MLSEAERQNVLPKDLMALQLGQIDLLTSMYTPDNAVHIDDSSVALIEALREWCEGGDTDVSMPEIPEPSITILLDLSLQDGRADIQGARPLQLSLTVPLLHQEDMQDAIVRARLLQPAWMSKAQVAELNAAIPDEDVLTIIEHVQEAASQHAEDSNRPAAAVAATALFDPHAPLVRAWFYFPSISTRAKRDDLVTYAPSYGLTGFLLAGKPGILCLEGGATAIDDFMKFIKTDSWGDIPPQHKKVSERYRESGLQLRRAFEGMREITEMIERGGKRANRGDMKALEAWLGENGVGEAFGKVLV